MILRFALIGPLLVVTFFLSQTSFGGQPPGTLQAKDQRRLLLATVEEGRRHFPNRYNLGFHYQRHDPLPADLELRLKITYLKILHNWAWLEAEGQNYGVSLAALLHKTDQGWRLQGLVQPRYVVCSEDCTEVRSYLFTIIRRQFPAVPPHLFPRIPADILPVLKNWCPELVYVLEYFQAKQGWAWLEVSPRSRDGLNQLEPIHALLRREGESWKILETEPCCGEAEDNPEIQGAGGFIHYLQKKYPGVPAEIFPRRRTR